MDPIKACLQVVAFLVVPLAAIGCGDEESGSLEGAARVTTVEIPPELEGNPQILMLEGVASIMNSGGDLDQLCQTYYDFDPELCLTDPANKEALEQPEGWRLHTFDENSFGTLVNEDGTCVVISIDGEDGPNPYINGGAVIFGDAHEYYAAECADADRPLVPASDGEQVFDGTINLYIR